MVNFLLMREASVVFSAHRANVLCKRLNAAARFIIQTRRKGTTPQPPGRNRSKRCAKSRRRTRPCSYPKFVSQGFASEPRAPSRRRFRPPTLASTLSTPCYGAKLKKAATVVNVTAKIASMPASLTISPVSRCFCISGSSQTGFAFTRIARFCAGWFDGQ